MKIWIKKDYKKDHVVMTFEDPKDGEIDPVLYIYIRVDIWVEIDLDVFKKGICPICGKENCMLESHVVLAEERWKHVNRLLEEYFPNKYIIKEKASGDEVMIIEPEEPEEYEDPFNEQPPEPMKEGAMYGFDNNFINGYPEQVGIVREMDGDEATVEIIDKTIADTQGRIWIHPKLLIAEFLEDSHEISRSLTIDDYITPEVARRQAIRETNAVIEKWEMRSK